MYNKSYDRKKDRRLIGFLELKFFLFIGIFVVMLILIVFHSSKINVLNYNIQKLQTKKLELENKRKIVLMKKNKLLEASRIKKLASTKLGLKKRDKEKIIVIKVKK